MSNLEVTEHNLCVDAPVTESELKALEFLIGCSHVSGL